MERIDIVGIVIDALDEEIAASLDGGAVGAATEETPLLGEGAPIDSLGLVSVIVQVEERLASEFGISVSLVDEKAMSQRNSPFRSVGALATYATECVLSAGENV
jgi:acyl carrier protein